jgi:hypothetical protein
VQIIDFVSQQVKLFPALASVFAIHFAASDLWDSYHEVTSSINQGDLQGLPEVLKTTIRIDSGNGLPDNFSIFTA